MNKRNCPVCGSKNADVIMRFTPELLAEVNPTYSIEEFGKAIRGKENMLTYSQCINCDMVYCENVWNNDVLRKVYNDTIDHVKSKDKILSIRKRLALTRMWMNILRVLTLVGKEKLENVKVIDYGCGWGDFLDVVNGFGVDVMGYDEDGQKTELPVERGHKIAKDINELKSFGPVDILVMNSVLEHLQDVDSTMNLIKELLRPNGLLVFSVMDYRSKFIRKNIRCLENKLPALTKNLNPVEHVNVYDYRSVMATLKRFNFKLISTNAALYLSDLFILSNNLSLIRFLIKMELLTTKFITGKMLGITVYALNNK